MRVSPETIYRSLYLQAHGALKKELTAYLRQHHGLRHSRHAGALGGRLLARTRNSYVVTLVERSSRFTLLVQVPNKET